MRVFQGNLEFFSHMVSKDIAFLIDSYGFHSLFHKQNQQTSASYWGWDLSPPAPASSKPVLFKYSKQSRKYFLQIIKGTDEILIKLVL